MANPTITDIGGDGSVKLFTYALTTADHTGTGLEWAQWADRSVTFTGTWGGSTAGLEGSNDGTTWIALADPQGSAISKTANGIEAVLELTRYVRPRLTVVGTGAAVTASILCRRAQPLRS